MPYGHESPLEDEEALCGVNRASVVIASSSQSQTVSNGRANRSELLATLNEHTQPMKIDRVPLIYHRSGSGIAFRTSRGNRRGPLANAEFRRDLAFAWWNTLPGIQRLIGVPRDTVVLCLEGELETTPPDGKAFTLTPGKSYQVADGESSHRSSTKTERSLSSSTELSTNGMNLDDTIVAIVLRPAAAVVRSGSAGWTRSPSNRPADVTKSSASWRPVGAIHRDLVDASPA